MTAENISCSRIKEIQWTLSMIKTILQHHEP